MPQRIGKWVVLGSGAGELTAGTGFHPLAWQSILWVAVAFGDFRLEYSHLWVRTGTVLWLGSCMLCQVTLKPGTPPRSKILSVSILLAPTPSQEFMAGVRTFQTKQNKVNGSFRKPTALHSYRHILSEVNWIKGVYIQKSQKCPLFGPISIILNFESSGEELHKMGFAFRPAMALFMLQVCNPADKSLGSPGRDGTRL